MQILLLLFLLFFSSFTYAASIERCKNVSTKTCEIYSQLGRGINLGNIFDAPYEGAWGEWFDEDYIKEVSQHFDSVRIPIRWSSYANQDSNAIIEPKFINRIDGIIKKFIDNGLIVILDLHHYSQLYGDKLNRGETKVDAEDVLPRFLSIWNQLSNHFKNHSQRLLFEPLNEPHGQIGDKEWEYLVSEVTSTIRKNDADRILVFGPTKWNSINKLNALKLPKQDKNIIVTVHSYEPFKFTHQGISYLFTKKYKNITCCNIYQANKIRHQLELAQKWSQQNGIPVFVGEFGSVNNADRNSRLNYLKTSIDTLNQLKIPWFYWNFSSDFGFYNSKTHKWDISALKILDPNFLNNENTQDERD